MRTSVAGRLAAAVVVALRCAALAHAGEPEGRTGEPLAGARRATIREAEDVLIDPPRSAAEHVAYFVGGFVPSADRSGSSVATAGAIVVTFGRTAGQLVYFQTLRGDRLLQPEEGLEGIRTHLTAVCFRNAFGYVIANTIDGNLHVDGCDPEEDDSLARAVEADPSVLTTIPSSYLAMVHALRYLRVLRFKEKFANERAEILRQIHTVAPLVHGYPTTSKRWPPGIEPAGQTAP